jgi:hypothetical protein
MWWMYFIFVYENSTTEHVKSFYKKGNELKVNLIKMYYMHICKCH